MPMCMRMCVYVCGCAIVDVYVCVDKMYMYVRVYGYVYIRFR